MSACQHLSMTTVRNTLCRKTLSFQHAQFYLHSSRGFLQGTAKAKLDDLKIYLEMIYQPRMQRYRMPEKRWSDWRHVMSYYAQVLDKVPELNWREYFDYKARRIIIREVQKLAPLCKTGTIPTMLSVRTLAAKLRKLQRTQGSAP